MMKQLILYYTTEKTESEPFIRRAASDYTGRDSTSWEIHREKLGKPFFTDPTLPFFSLSHSGIYTVCALCDVPLGVDVQEHRFRGGDRSDDALLRIASRFFHPDEAAHLCSLREKSLPIPTPFFRIWTAKESYVKYTGRGIGDFPAFNVLDPAAYHPAVIKEVPFAPNTTLCLTAEEDFTLILKEI